MAMRPETEVKVKRWREQRWLLDNIIQSVGPDWDQARTIRILRVCGPTVSRDVQLLRGSIKKFDDIPVQCAAVGEKWQKLAGEEERLGHLEAAREYYLFAAIFYCHAQWGIFEDDNQEKMTYSHKKNACYDKVIAYAPYHMERVEIPFEGKYLPAVLHLPRKGNPPFPAVLSLPGMDSVKEDVALYGDALLERGLAVLKMDGPGQGESNLRKIRVTATNYEQAGKNAVDYLSARKDVKSDSIGMVGASMGTYWGFRVAAAEPRIRSCALHFTCFEPGMNSIFNMASPSFKLNYMYMTGYNDEQEFDAFARTLTLKGLGSKIRCPILIQAGEYDDLSPLGYTYELFDEIKAPKKLVVYRGEKHPIPNYQQMVNTRAADWVADRLKGRPLGPGEKEIEFFPD